MNSAGHSLEIESQNGARQPLVTRGQRGGARIRTLIWMALLVSFIFFSYKVIPPYFANYQLEDWLKTQIPFLMVTHTTDDALYASIIREMHNEGIEVTNDNIKIIQNNSRGINVQIDYTVKLDLLVYQTNLHFTPEMNSQALVQ
jgi:hypothetical protein